MTRLNEYLAKKQKQEAIKQCIPDPNEAAIIVGAAATTGMMLGGFAGPIGMGVGFSAGFLAASIGEVALDAYKIDKCMKQVDKEEAAKEPEPPPPAPQPTPQPQPQINYAQSAAVQRERQSMQFLGGFNNYGGFSASAGARWRF